LHQDAVQLHRPGVFANLTTKTCPPGSEFEEIVQAGRKPIAT